ncbi:hypothetical protein GALMADRAFT_208154 [Galerina marginata CBS 339.88]|uniref:Uncharacterized protein n=1 Tax=Galerina marginata (strain CBS 339.88) TaxID=685588 RepID=A0A067TIZ1_GALM3|nr:hypothetical protein GALMADRAFT_208154 [Galerina marginata CBS 339.88]
MTNASVPNPEVWQRLRNAALVEGTVRRISQIYLMVLATEDKLRNPVHTTFSTRPIEPSALLGSYASVWDGHTEMECTDDESEEISWLHLTVDPFLMNRTSVKDTKTKSGAKTNQSSRPIKPSDPITFTDIQGEFKWWDMVGSFRGLYRPNYGTENIWLFGDVSWRPLEEDEGGYRPGDEPDDHDKNTDDFGLATLLTLDDSGQPFLEMLYNGTKYYYTQTRKQQIRATGETGSEVTLDPSCAGDSSALVYVRVLWKKQEVAGRESNLMISEGEGQRLIRDTAVNLERGLWDLESLDEDKKGDAEGENDISGDDEGDENGPPEDKQNTLVPGVKRELDGEDMKLAKKRKF